ncbi:S8 family serine peptidase, partial [Shewanella benthica]|nr:S8 family serine peptidase [Shewanella benthica]
MIVKRFQVSCLFFVMFFSGNLYASEQDSDHVIISQNGSKLSQFTDQVPNTATIVGAKEAGIRYEIRSTPSDHLALNYLVELNSPPLLSHKKRAKQRLRSQFSQESTQTSSAYSIANQAYRTSITHYSQLLEQSQISTFDKINRLVKGAKLVHRFTNTTNMLVLALNANELERVRSLPEVKRVTQEQIFSATLSESVPLINAPAVWKMLDSNDNLLKGTGIVVAVLDSGIDYTHPDLGGCMGEGCRVVAGYDFVNDDTDPMDGYGHGTHVAGIIGANGLSMQGVAPEVTFHAYKVLSDQGYGATSGIIAALEKAVDPDGDPLTDDAVDIINMSLGGGGSADGPLSQAVNVAVQNGIVVVVAAGNDGGYGDINNSEPASSVEAITVASSTKEDELSSFSSKALPAEVVKPEITAPGSDIYSTMPNSSYASMSGTSMAAPHVAGAVALLLQQQPELMPAQVKSMVMAGGVDLGLDPYAQGTGRLDLVKSINTSIVAKKGFAHFGRLDVDVDVDGDSFNNTQSITLTNLTDNDIRYLASFSGGLAENAQLSLSIEQVVIPANSSITVDISLLVNDPSNFPVANTGSGVQFGRMLLTSESANSFEVPLSLEHYIEATLTTNSPGSVWVFVESNDRSFTSSAQLSQGVEEQIRLTNKPSSMFVLYAGLNETHVSDDLPAGATVVGMETFELHPTANFSQHFDINHLVHTIGVGSVSGMSGEALPVSSVRGDFIDYTVRLNDMLYYMGMNGAYHVQPMMPYLAVGNLAQGSQLEINKMYMVDESLFDSDEQHHFVYMNEIPADQVSDHHFDIDFATTTNAEVELNSNQKLGTYAFQTSAFGYSYSLFKESSAQRVVTHYLPEQSQVLPAVTAVSQLDKASPYSANYSYIASTPFFAVNDLGGLDLYSDLFSLQEKLISSPDTSISLRPEGLFWSSEVWVGESHVDLWDVDVSLISDNFISDVRENEHELGLNTQYSFYCNGSDGSRVVMVSGHLPAIVAQKMSIALPVESCSGSKFLQISYDNYLGENLYRSNIEFELSSFTIIDSIAGMNLYEGELLVGDQILDKLNSNMIIRGKYNLNLSGVDLRLDGGEWQELTANDLGASKFSIDIPMVAGNSIADMRVRYRSNSDTQVVQTLNGLFRLGADAGLEKDVDGDGIINSEDKDNDNDGIDDEWEYLYGLNPYDPDDASLDFDGDGLSNQQEYLLGLNPNLSDSDGDGIDDGVELTNGSDPLDENSFVGSQLTLIAFDDVNNDGISDWLGYETLESSVAITLFDGSSFANIASFELSHSFESPEVYQLGDRTGDGTQELGIFGFDSGANRYQLIIHNGETGQTLGKWNWPATLGEVEFVALDDLTLDGVQEYAITGIHLVNGARQLVVKDGSTKGGYQTFKWPNLWANARIV